MEHIENSTIYGLAQGELRWNPTFNAVRDDKGRWTGGESFTCRLKDITTLLPNNGAPCQMEGFDFLKVSSVEVTNIEGDLAEVSCKYVGYWSSTGEGGGPQTDDEKYTYELQISSSEELIETHPDFQINDPIPKEEWMIIRNVQSGQFIPSKTEDYAYVDSGSNANIKPLKITTNEGKRLIDYIVKGLDKYLVPKQIWRATYIDDKKPEASLFNAVGKIQTPIGAPDIANNRNWLFMGLSMQEKAGIYTITLEWHLSGLNGWDDDIYETA